MEKIYSYYSINDGNVVEETLSEHIKNALDVINSIESSKIGKVVHDIFPYIKGLYEISKMLIVFHDLGKVFYQMETNKIARYLSFKGHEFLSTYIFENFYLSHEKMWASRDIFGIDIIEPLKFAILFHHHAMDIRKREELLKNLGMDNLMNGISLFNQLYEDVEVFLNPEDRKTFKNALDKISEKIKSTDSFINQLRLEIRREVNDVWRNVWINSGNKKISLLLLSVLIVADNMSAQMKRGSSKTVFHWAVEEFYRFYFVSVQRF